MTEVSGWPLPPREPGPWGGGPPVAPAGNTPLPPLPGPGGVSRPAASNPAGTPFAGTPFAGPPGAPPLPPPGPPGPFFPGLQGQTIAPVDRAPRWLVALAGLVVVALVAGGAALVLKGGRSFPSSWDARVEPIARWVAEERGLSFDHPVEVEFLSEAAYSEASTGGEDVESSPEDDAALDDLLAQFRALGLIEGDVDLGAATDTLADSGTLAYYDPAAEMVFVRGTELTPALRVTLAHELTHVLQDQRFDLERIQELPDGQATTLRALAEGDATRIEEIYAADVLTDDERAAYEAEARTSGEEATETLDEEVPPVLTALFAAPYIFGPELVAFLDRDGGQEAIDGALEDPPGEEVLFNPLVSGTEAGEDPPLTLEPPADAEALDDGEFGPTAWYLLLASRMEPAVALEAADGLGSDGYVVFRQDDRVCVRAHAEGDAETDVAELQAALTAWVAKSPADTASVEEVDGEVRFESCDPGADAEGAGTVAVDLLQLPVLRTQLYGQVIDGGGTDEQARCFAHGIIERFTFAQISDDAYLGSPEGQQALAEVQGGCA